MRAFLLAALLFSACGDDSSDDRPLDAATEDASDDSDAGVSCTCRGPGTCARVAGSPQCTCDEGFERLLATRCVPEGGPIDPGYALPVQGFGREATGGAGGTTVEVTDYGDDGAGTLRQRLRDASGPTVVRFVRDGTIALEGSALLVPSNVTLDARGVDVRLTGFGLRLEGVENVVVLNLAFVDIDDSTGGDGIQMIGARDVAVLHCRFDNGGLDFLPDIPDEQISVVAGSRDITIAWSAFRHHDKVMLLGNGDSPELDRELRVTLYANLFEETGRRHPFMRSGRVDMFNSIVRDWNVRLEGFGAYGSRAEADGELLLEANLYDQSDSTQPFAALTLDGDGRLRLVDNVLAQRFLVVSDREPETVFTRPYPATVHPMTDRLVAAIEAGAGNTVPAP